MQPPDELMTDSFLPALRVLVSKRLRGQGMSQTSIASALGVTQASVSSYISSGAGKVYASLAGFSVDKEEADRYAALLSEDVRRDPSYSVGTLTSIWTDLLGKGKACALHREMYPSLSSCDVCVKEYGSRRVGSSDAVAEVAQAVKELEKSRHFVNVMPEVSVNVACIPAGSEEISDVVAVPGRIVRVKGSARATFPPEAGASKHLAKVLLLARSRDPGLRACINIMYDGKVGKAMKRLMLRPLEIGGYPPSGADPTVEAMRKAMESAKGRFDSVIDTGGPGIEPNAYLFGAGANQAVRLALRVSDLCSAR